MATVPVLRTWAANDEPTATMFNTELRDAYSFLLNPPRAMVYKAAGQNVQAFTTGDPCTLLTWDTEWFDSDGIFSGGAASRLTCRTAGVYDITVHVEWQHVDAAASGNRFIAVQKNNNGGTTRHTATEIAADYQIVQVSSGVTYPQTSHLCFMHSLIVGDYLEVTAMQSSGSSISTVNSDASRTFFSMVWWGM